MNTHTTRLIRMGNARGVRIPKRMIERAGLGDRIEISVCQDGVVISPIRARRAGWDAQFEAMAVQGDDRLLDAPRSTESADADWVW